MDESDVDAFDGSIGVGSKSRFDCGEYDSGSGRSDEDNSMDDQEERSSLPAMMRAKASRLPRLLHVKRPCLHTLHSCTVRN